MMRRENAAASGEAARRSALRIDCDAVLFDMDGTLVDSTAVVERHWRRWAAEHGVDLAEILRVSHGRPTLETLRIVAPHLATIDEAARLDAAEAVDSDGLLPVPGALELIASLPPDRWAVVTSAGAALATRRLQGASLPVPPVLVTVDDVPYGKPSPLGYVEAARRLGASPARSLVIEDAPVGIEAGRAAGAVVIGVTTTFPHLTGCECVISDLRSVRVVSRSASSVRLEVDAAREG